MINEDTINDRDDNNEIQGNDSEIKTDIQEETGDTGREEIEIVTEEKEETKEDNNSSLEQMKKVLMTYIDKIVDEKISVVKETEIKEEIKEEPEEEKTLFNSFKEF